MLNEDNIDHRPIYEKNHDLIWFSLLERRSLRRSLISWNQVHESRFLKQGKLIFPRKKAAKNWILNDDNMDHKFSLIERRSLPRSLPDKKYIKTDSSQTRQIKISSGWDPTWPRPKQFTGQIKFFPSESRSVFIFVTMWIKKEQKLSLVKLSFFAVLLNFLPKQKNPLYTKSSCYLF